MRKVLVIESDAAVRECLKRFLIRQNFEALTASDGSAGLHKAREYNPEIIICGGSLPDMPLPGLIKKVRSYKHTFGIPFIIRCKSRKDCYPAETNVPENITFLPEPVKPADMLKSMNETLKLSHDDIYSVNLHVENSGNYVISLVAGEMEKTIYFSDIIVISSDDNRSEIFLAEGRSFMVRKSFESWDMMLPCGNFIRLDDNYIINADHIDNVWMVPGKNKMDIRMKGYNFYINADEIYDERLINKAR